MNEEFIREIIKSTINGEPHLGTNLKEQCLKYFYDLISENQQLKQQQKEFIEWLENKMKETHYTVFEFQAYRLAFEKYKEIVGYKE